MNSEVDEMTVNKLEIRIAALQRTGHHAIIEWMLDGIEGKRIFLNNVRPGKPVFNPEWIMMRPDHRLIRRGFAAYDLMLDVSGAFQKKDALIYNYENTPLEIAFPQNLEKLREHDVGKSERIADVIVCRDPLNNAASYYKKFAEKYSDREFADWMQLWCDYAEAGMSTKTLHGKAVIPIHYSLWVASANYRKMTALLLGFIDGGIPRQTAKWGQGSSFAQGVPTETEVNHTELRRRWVALRDVKRFQALFRDARVLRVSREYLKAIDDAEGLEHFSEFSRCAKLG